ncbi:hypothetical protein [Ideonella paludis]|uniref:Uncharacterized protein n=1 Tax=Ideonella paludis TaxID=1233411 RepID=A0ABS5DVD0_9BURK|nr:hypothetical protein [Ideonella paludis]MBQ0935110.1 hypothetical protein [Ideonella paludis]
MDSDRFRLSFWPISIDEIPGLPVVKFAFAVGFILCSSVLHAQSQVDYNRALVTVATEAENGYLRMQPVSSLGCKFDVVYFPLSTSPGRAKLALLLTGKAIQKNLSVVSYAKDTSGFCWAQTIELAP